MLRDIIVDVPTYEELDRLWAAVLNDEEGRYPASLLNDITQLQGEIVLADLRRNVEEPKCLTG